MKYNSVEEWKAEATRRFGPDMLKWLAEEFEIEEMAPTADLDCTGCVWLNTRHQKCSCCRRNQYIKDNYREA